MINFELDICPNNYPQIQMSISGTNLLKILRQDNATELKQLIDSGLDKNSSFPSQNEISEFENGTPLICCSAFLGSFNCLKYLFDIGADKTLTDDDGMGVALYGVMGNHFNILQYLCEIHYSIKGCAHFALRRNFIDLFKQLINSNCTPINEKDLMNNTFLHIAVLNHLNDIISFILEKIKSLSQDDQISFINSQDHEGRTALHLACGEGDLQVVQTLLTINGINSNIQDRYGKPPLHYAVATQSLPIIEFFFGGDINLLRNGKTLLMKAASENNISLLQILLDINGIDIQKTDDDKRNALHYAAMKNSAESIQYLLNNTNIDPNSQDKNGQTPLHLAVAYNSLQVVKVLMSNSKVNKTIKDIYGKTPSEVNPAHIKDQEFSDDED